MNDVRVETFEFDITNDLETKTLSNDVGSTDRAFVRINNGGLMKLCGGELDTNNITLGPNVLGCGIELTSSDTLTFHKQTTATVKHMGEVWRYEGPEGGPNEFKVHRYAIPVNAGDFTVSQDVSGDITDRNKCVPFMCSFKSDLGGTFRRTSVGAFIDDSDNLVLKRNDAGFGSNVFYVDLVEFTGSNWSVGHAISSNHNTARELVTLNTDSRGFGGSTFSVTAWDEVFFNATMEGDNIETGLSDLLGTVYEDSDGSLDKVWFDIHTYGDITTRNSESAYIQAINNPQMKVYREDIFEYSEGASSYGSNIFTHDIVDTANDSDLYGIEWFPDTTGTGTAFGRGFISAKYVPPALEKFVYDGNAQEIIPNTLGLGNIRNFRIACGISLGPTPRGIIYEIGGSGHGVAIGFDSDGSLVARGGDGSALNHPETVKVTITSAEYDFANKTGYLEVFFNGRNKTVTVEFDENETGTIDISKTSTPITTLINWAGTDDGRVGAMFGSVAGGSDQFSTSTFNGYFYTPVYATHAIDRGRITTWVHRNGNNVDVVYSFIDLSGLKSDGGKLNAWEGSSWVKRDMKVWTGKLWDRKLVKRWDGSKWVVTV